MGKLACQLSLAPSLTALFLCLATRGWEQGARREGHFSIVMKPGDPEASCGAQASGGADCGTWYPASVLAALRSSIPWCPIMPPLKQAEAGVGHLRGWSVPWELLGCGILSRSLFTATSLQAPIQ